jgi:hypothetical protein
VLSLCGSIASTRQHASVTTLDGTPTRDSLRAGAQQVGRTSTPDTVVRNCAYRRATKIHVRMTLRRRKGFVNPASDVSQTRRGSYATFPSSHCCFDGFRAHCNHQPRHHAGTCRPRGTGGGGGGTTTPTPTPTPSSTDFALSVNYGSPSFIGNLVRGAIFGTPCSQCNGGALPQPAYVCPIRSAASMTGIRLVSPA